jgi:hypothetical protein
MSFLRNSSIDFSKSLGSPEILYFNRQTDRWGILLDTDRKHSSILGKFSTYLSQSWVEKSGLDAMIDELNRRGGCDGSSKGQELELNASINVNLAIMVWSQRPKAVYKPINVFPNHS